MSLTVFFVLFCLIGTLSACLLYEIEDRNRSAQQPKNKTESALKFPSNFLTTIDFSFDSARNLRFPGMTTVLTTEGNGLRRIYFRPDNEQIFFLALSYIPSDQLHGIHMFNASGALLNIKEKCAILQSEQSLSRWMGEQLQELKQQKLRRRRNLIDEL